VEAAGAELLVLCTNTMHRLADQVQAAIDIPLLHIADATAQAIGVLGIGRAGLLGTPRGADTPTGPVSCEF